MVPVVLPVPVADNTPNSVIANPLPMITPPNVPVVATGILSQNEPVGDAALYAVTSPVLAKSRSTRIYSPVVPLFTNSKYGSSQLPPPTE